MKYRITFLIVLLLILLFGCRTTKETTQENTQTNIKKNEVITENVKEKVLEEINRLLEQSKSATFESNLNLIPSKDSEVVRYVEIREGKPFREIEIKGGSLQERKQVRDTIYIRDTTSVQRNVETFKNKIDSLKLEINQIKELKKKTKKQGGAWGFVGWLVAIVIVLILIILFILKIK